VFLTQFEIIEQLQKKYIKDPQKTTPVTLLFIYFIDWVGNVNKAEEVGLGGWWGGPWCRSLRLISHTVILWHLKGTKGILTKSCRAESRGRQKGERKTDRMLR